MIKHLWIVMDWNRRWAKKRFLPATAGHKAWADNVRNIAKLCEEKWVKYLTLWALSTDNLTKRGKDEVDWIIKLINNIKSFLWEMFEERVRFNVIWDTKRLPIESQKILNEVIEETKRNIWIVLTVALIYWWQDEIVRATKRILKAWVDPETLNETEFRKYLDTKDLPIPDMIVRTGWDVRHSGFLLYDSEYSEYFFSKKNWPEFDKDELDKVIESFEWSKRNFWK